MRGNNQVPPLSGRIPRLAKPGVEIVEHHRRSGAEIELRTEIAAGVEHPERLLLPHLGRQVEPGTEGPAGTREHDAPHVPVAIGPQQLLRQIVQHRP